MARVDGVSSNAVPVEVLALDGTGAPIDAVGTFVLSNIVAAVTRASDGYTYDWSDATFKASPVTGTTALSAYDTSSYPGLFHIPAGWTFVDDDTYSITISQVGSPAVVSNLPVTNTLYVGELVGGWTQGSNLVDDLVDVADSLRDELHADFGVRQFALYGVRRVWSGATVGVGSCKVSGVSEFIPSPAVTLEDTHALTEGGLLAEGTAKLEEVSLTYTQGQILGEPPVDNEEWILVLADKLGQGISRRFYIPQDHPETDRDGSVGWNVTLRMIEPRNVVA